MRPAVFAADVARQDETSMEVNVEKQPRRHVGFRPIKGQA